MFDKWCRPWSDSLNCWMWQMVQTMIRFFKLLDVLQKVQTMVRCLKTAGHVAKGTNHGQMSLNCWMCDKWYKPWSDVFKLLDVWQMVQTMVRCLKTAGCVANGADHVQMLHSAASDLVSILKEIHGILIFCFLNKKVSKLFLFLQEKICYG